MSTLTDREKKFINRWEKKRQHKTKFILTHGALLWGIPTAIIAYFLTIEFDLNAFEWLAFGLTLLIMMLAGIGFGYFLFWFSEKRYKRLTQN